MKTLRILIQLMMFFTMVGWSLWAVTELIHAADVTSVQLRIIIIGLGVVGAYVIADYLLAKFDQWVRREYFDIE